MQQKLSINGYIGIWTTIMNTKKLIVFLLWAFLPMVIVEVVMHLIGTSTAGLSEDSIDTLAVIKGMVLSAGAMFTPLLAIILTQLIFKEPVLKNLDIYIRKTGII